MFILGTPIDSNKISITTTFFNIEDVPQEIMDKGFIVDDENIEQPLPNREGYTSVGYYHKDVGRIIHEYKEIVSPPINDEVQQKLDMLENDNLTLLNAVAELYEMVLMNEQA